jgi:RNA-directed DNA polymerase
VIDIWFNQVAKKYMRGPVELFKYADDIIICCRFKEDAVRLKTALEKRLNEFSLKMNEKKTKVVSFSKRQASKGIRQGTFEFLGFLFYLGKSRRGQIIPKVKTCGKRFASKLRNVSKWMKMYRCRVKLRPLWRKFCIKLAGHIRYYGVSHNSKGVSRFIYEARRIFFKWINRRSQRKSLTWAQFKLFEQRFPLPPVKVYHSLFEPTVV